MKWIALLMFGTVGLIAFIGGGYWGYERFMLYQTGTTVVGTVVEEYRSSNSTYPVVEFAAGNGKTIRFHGSTGNSGAPDYEVGTQIKVLYDPANPAEAQIADFEQFWLGPLAVSIFGFLFLLAGIGSFFLVRNSDKTFGPAFRQRMDQVALEARGDGIRLKGTVAEVRRIDDENYVVVCRARLTSGNKEERFESAPIFFDPGRAIIGKPVDILVDPFDKSRHVVELQPLLDTLTR